MIKPCDQCEHSDVVYFEMPCAACDGSLFEPKVDKVLQRALDECQERLRKALTAIEEHRGATKYYNGFQASRGVDENYGRSWSNEQQRSEVSP